MNPVLRKVRPGLLSAAPTHRPVAAGGAALSVNLS